MPVLKHAKKKQRQDKKRTVANRVVENSYKSLVKAAKKSKTAASLQKAFQAIDKAAKHHIIHQNKAARLKSSLSKLVSVPSTKQTPIKSGQTASKVGTKPASKKIAVSRKPTAKKTTKASQN